MIETIPLSQFVEINPKIKLIKGTEYPFVEMNIVTPGCRYISSVHKRNYNGGGAKFQAGDTLFARITPCLENGKIAQFIGKNGEIGFGSTEFFVFRYKEGISDPGYVFYLANSDIVRKPAEKSMFGASGRQRADLASIKDLEIPAPPLPTQRKIAAILSDYDDLIENNTRRIKILEEMAQMLYREWFVKLRFPGHEKVKMVESELGMVPEGWEVGRLKDALILQRGFDLPTKKREQGNIPIYAATGVVGTHNEAKVKGPCVVTGRSGSIGTVIYVDEDFWPLNTTLWVKEFRRATPIYAYYLLKRLELSYFNSGAAVPTLNRNDIHGLFVILPSYELLECFNQYIIPIFSENKILNEKNANLRRTRDLLLPKLISGNINVESLDICEER